MKPVRTPLLVKTFYTGILVLILPIVLFQNVTGLAQNKQSPGKSSARKQSGLPLYERIGKKLSRNPKLAAYLRAPAEEMKEVSWMVGTWEIESRVFRTSSEPERVSRGTAEVSFKMGSRWLFSHDTYPGGGEDDSYLSFNPFTKRWVSMTVDGYGNAVTATASKWEGNRLVFLAKDIEVLGERVTLRQTMEKRSDTEYHILNEERLPNGKWVALDEYTYRKKSTSN